MPLVLHRFPISHFSEKGRALLAFKRLHYRIVEHRLGTPQIDVWRLSGQRKVPVLEHTPPDGPGRVVPDSTEIALYLEKAYPNGRALLPRDEAARAETLALEDRLDRELGIAAPVVWFRHAIHDPRQVDVLPLEVQGLGPRGARALAAVARSAERFGGVARFHERCERKLRATLGDLCDRLARTRHLAGDEPGLADVAAAGLTLHLEFPKSRHLAVPDLAGVGVPGIADDPAFARFFAWRRAFYAEYLD